MSRHESRWPLLAGLVSGLAASLCCLGPLVLLLLGISGAWISYLTLLEPVQPLFVVMSLGFLFIAYRRIYPAPPRQTCDEGRACSRPVMKRTYRMVFWLALMLVAFAVLSPVAMPLFY